MLKWYTRAQVASWNIRQNAAVALRKEDGEANVFAIIVGILIVTIVLGGVAFLLIKAGTGVTDKAKNCLENPTSCNNSGGITVG